MINDDIQADISRRAARLAADIDAAHLHESGLCDPQECRLCGAEFWDGPKFAGVIDIDAENASIREARERHEQDRALRDDQAMRRAR